MERLMQYIWQHRLFKPGVLRTVDNHRIEIIDQGTLNTSSGPDFFNAKVKIGDRIWAGNVEIHVRASDWMRHGHDRDTAYDSVVLHVVDKDDMAIHRTNGELIPQMRLPAAPDFAVRYAQIVDRADRELPCRDFVASLHPVHVRAWLDALGMERLYSKVDRIEALYKRLGEDWREVFYVVTARALGFGTNAEPFERLALSTPYRFLAHHADDLMLVEAALFGQSGLLPAASGIDPYIDSLKREYSFMCAKFGIKPPQSLGWKTGRLRPGNLPYRRIAMLASLVANLNNRLNALLCISEPEEACDLFALELTGFWVDHYSLSAAPTPGATPCALGKSSLRTMAINVVAPFLYAYSRHRGHTDGCRLAVEMLEELPPEQNALVDTFAAAGIKNSSAFVSQALLHLRREYCLTRKCLYCRFGHRLLSCHATRS